MKAPIHLFAGMAFLSACSGGPGPTEAATLLRSSAAATAAAPTAKTTASRNMDRDRQGLREGLQTIRQVTAPFHDFNVAKAAGWSTEITACLVNPDGPGAMGFHYGNTSLIDGTAEVDKPQLLLYAPGQDGGLHLTAVEYIIPYADHARDAAPPTLLGQQFLQFDAFQVWGLHVWIWKDNPAGLFAPWNTLVSCSNTTDVAAMRH